MYGCYSASFWEANRCFCFKCLYRPQVWTSTASGVRKELSDKCVANIFKETKSDFTALDFGKGLTYLLGQYL